MVANQYSYVFEGLRVVRFFGEPFDCAFVGPSASVVGDRRVQSQVVVELVLVQELTSRLQSLKGYLEVVLSGFTTDLLDARIFIDGAYDRCWFLSRFRQSIDSGRVELYCALLAVPA